jgi:Fic family protein
VSDRAGHFVSQGQGQAAYKAFLPKPLPPDPPLRVGPETQRRLEAANLSLGRLDGIGRYLPDADVFLYMYIRKEAVLSSQIEGTQSSLADLLLHENASAPGVPVGDVREVSNYVAAMGHGLQLLQRLPLCLRVVREVHGVLVSGTRGQDKTPGEFRRSQNWIGGSRPGNARFVPPPAHEVPAALGDLEKFLHDEVEQASPIVKAGLAHAQFETIHPFLDGNGRVGRLLITLIFVASGVLARPLLYMSLHFKRHRQEYYERLQRVRVEGDWEGWIDFYLDGVVDVASQAAETVDRLLRLFEADRQAVSASRGGTVYQRAAAQSNLQVYEYLRRRAVLGIPEAARALSLSKPTVARVLSELEALGIAREITGKARNRTFVYQKYMDVLNEEAGALE